MVMARVYVKLNGDAVTWSVVVPLWQYVCQRQVDVPSWVAASIARLILRRVRSLVLFHRTWRLNCHLVWYCGFLRITDPVILAGRGDGRLVTFGSQPRLIGMDWKSLSVEEEREHNIHVRCSFFLFIPLSVFVGTEIRLFGIAIMVCRSHDLPRCWYQLA